jgi:hypothetical protein
VSTSSRSATDFTTALVNISRLGERIANEALSEVMEIPEEGKAT